MGDRVSGVGGMSGYDYRPSRKGKNVDTQTGYQWIAYVTKLPLDEVMELVGPEAAVVLGWAISRNRLVNPPRWNEVPVKLTVFTCQECGRRFERKWTTKPYKYCSPACKTRAYRRRKRGEGGPRPGGGDALREVERMRKGRRQAAPCL